MARKVVPGWLIKERVQVMVDGLNEERRQILVKLRRIRRKKLVLLAERRCLLQLLDCVKESTDGR